MAYVIVEDCTGCTACVKRCPTDAIHGRRKGLHDINPDLCIDCGACAPVCSDNAIFNNLGMRVMFKKKKEWPLAFVDEINCVGCEKCVDECPFDAIWIANHPVDASFHGVCIVEAKKCTGCRICEWACPYDAIFIYPKNEVPDWLQSSFLPRDDSRSEEIEWRKFRTPAFDSDQEEQDAAAAGNE
ncbi:MAG: 4Fe-4S binding protein [Myxococcota bacterium]|nr:4Fe-4S binding protein [Myxococcota bacterium]